MVAQFRKHLKPGTLIVVGGGYMGQRATKGCGKPPVLQMLLTVSDEDIAWSVILRLAREMQWKILDPSNGRELSP